MATVSVMVLTQVEKQESAFFVRKLVAYKIAGIGLIGLGSRQRTFMAQENTCYKDFGDNALSDPSFFVLPVLQISFRLKRVLHNQAQCSCCIPGSMRYSVQTGVNKI